MWLLVWVYGFWFAYMGTGLVICLLVWLYGYWLGYMCMGLVSLLLVWLLVSL